MISCTKRKFVGKNVAFTHSCRGIEITVQSEPPLFSSVFTSLTELSPVLLSFARSFASATRSIISGGRTLLQIHFRNQQEKKCALVLLRTGRQQQVYLLLQWCEPSRISILVFYFRFIPFSEV